MASSARITPQIFTRVRGIDSTSNFWERRPEMIASTPMRFHVTGINHGSGARMSLDVEAGSKAAAERKAQNAGMDVQHVQPITDADPPQPHSTRRGEDAGGSGSLVKVLIVIAVIAVITI